MGLFGGSSSSSSSSTKNLNRKEIISGADDSLKDLSGSTGPLGVVSATGTKGGTIKSVIRTNSRIDGLQGADVATIIGGIGDLAGRFGGALAGVVERSDANTSGALQVLADTTRSATGTESETGRLLNKLITPALIALGLWLAFKVFGK